MSQENIHCAEIFIKIYFEPFVNTRPKVNVRICLIQLVRICVLYLRICFKIVNNFSYISKVFYCFQLQQLLRKRKVGNYLTFYV